MSTAASVSPIRSQPPQRVSLTLPDEQQIRVEIADTEARRERGLMYRNSLPENQGMLFIHPESRVLAVWMKNTLIPLDVIFLSSNGKIVSMLQNLTPCNHDPCPISTSTEKANYMLEVNAGFIEKHQLEVGQGIDINDHHHLGD
ncbi:MAG: DUF192 domain-containing protein [Gammaproteobacteria bacterium]